MKTENGTFCRYLYGRLTDSHSDLGTAMDGYGYDDTEMEWGGRVFSSGTEVKAPPHKCPKA